MTKLKALAATTAAAVALAAGTAHAGILVSDDFEGYGASSVANFTGFDDLVLTNGSVDLVREPDLGLATPFGVGMVNMDGAAAGAPNALSTQVLSYGAGETITFDFDASGNQRSGADSWLFGIAFEQNTLLSVFQTSEPGFVGGPHFPAVAITGFSASQFSQSTQPWGHYTARFTAINAGQFRAFIRTSSQDGMGVLIDNFRVYSGDLPTGIVPEPATWGLLIAGFAMSGAALRRRRVAA